jgi:hypothetical protein
MEASPLGVALQDDALHVVVEHAAGTATQVVEGADMSGEEVLEALVEEELQIKCPGVSQSQHQAAQPPQSLTDANEPEVGPVDLSLLAGESFQTDKGFLHSGSQAPDETSHLSDATRVATLSDHLVDSSGSEARIFF